MKRISRLLVFLLAGTVALFNGSIACAEEEETAALVEDFFITEAVYPQEQGEVQITVSPEYSSDEEGDEFTFDLGLELGLTDHLQLETSWSAFRYINPDQGQSVRGISDFGIGLKYTFDECEATGIMMALGFEATLPTGKNDVSENSWVYEPFIILSKDLGDDFNLHLNVAYGFIDPDDSTPRLEPGELGDEDEFRDELEVNLAAAYRVSRDWRLTLEANLETNEVDNGNETEIFLTPGILWKGLDNFEMGVGTSIGLNSDSADWRVLGMLSYEFELFDND